jgi:hypothetical protein
MQAAARRQIATMRAILSHHNVDPNLRYKVKFIGAYAGDNGLETAHLNKAYTLYLPVYIRTEPQRLSRLVKWATPKQCQPF